MAKINLFTVQDVWGVDQADLYVPLKSAPGTSYFIDVRHLRFKNLLRRRQNKWFFSVLYNFLTRCTRKKINYYLVTQDSRRTN